MFSDRFIYISLISTPRPRGSAEFGWMSWTCMCLEVRFGYSNRPKTFLEHVMSVLRLRRLRERRVGRPRRPVCERWAGPDPATRHQEKRGPFHQEGEHGSVPKYPGSWLGCSSRPMTVPLSISTPRLAKGACRRRRGSCILGSYAR